LCFEKKRCWLSTSYVNLLIQAQADKKKKRPLLSPADDAKFAGWEKGPKRLEGELPEELKKKIKHNPL
tara:strand:+ start:481 stop:684 length:204 start_codon:yes stop_codon:yes gene_type:complete